MAKETPISVHDKEHPALGATEEAQDVSSLNKVVVPMGSHTDPNNPAAAEGSVNQDLASHPVEHSDDYGADVEPGVHQVITTMDAGTEGAGGEGGTSDKKREDWVNADYKEALADAGLSVSGNRQELQARLEEHEAQEEEYKAFLASDWTNAVEEAETTEDLDELRAAYDRSGASFSTVESAFEDAKTELNKE